MVVLVLFKQETNESINQWKNLMINCNLFVISRANVNSCSAVRGKILTRMMNEYINWNQIKRIGFFLQKSTNDFFIYTDFFTHSVVVHGSQKNRAHIPPRKINLVRTIHGVP